jgi:lysophospholipase-2
MSNPLNPQVGLNIFLPKDTQDHPPSTSTTVVAPLGDSHTHTVIFLHGREDFGEDCAQDFLNYKALDGRTLAEIFPSIKWIFPTAKLRYSARRDLEFSSSSFAELLKGEEVISQWFDLWDIKTPYEKQHLIVDGLRESIDDIFNIVQEESKTVPLGRLVLGGMSQGCATAIFTLLYSGLTLGGFIGMYSWLPFQNIVSDFSSSIKNKEDMLRRIRHILEPQQSATPGGGITGIDSHDIDNLETMLTGLSICEGQGNSIDTPIFLSHSRDDVTVPFEHGEGLRNTLCDVGASDVTWKEYQEGGHSIHPRYGVDDIATFLRKVLKI